ncbi:MAG: fumarate hydratase [archaeon]
MNERKKPDLVEALVELYKMTSICLPEDVKEKIMETRRKEKNMLAKKVMDAVKENIEIAEKKQIPLCEDTGIPVFFVETPKGISQKEVKEKILKATEIATEKNFLRPNAVDSLTQKNSGNCIGKGIPTVYFEEKEGNGIKFNLLLKGGGSENIGKTYSLPNPELNAGRDLNGIKKCVLDAVVKAQGLGCPPNIVSVVVGGSKDAIAVESKKQLLEKLNEKSNEKEILEFEEKLLKEINSLKIGPMGLGGKTTAFTVKVKFLARHPASFFVEVAFCCWADRRHSLKWDNGEAEYD